MPPWKGKGGHWRYIMDLKLNEVQTEDTGELVERVCRNGGCPYYSGVKMCEAADGCAGYENGGEERDGCR